MMDLSIIVVNWNTHDLLAICLQSIYETIHNLAFEVIVIDNASCDRSPEMVEQRYPHVRLIRNQENVGFARANNQGILISTGRYILLLNSDTKMINESIKEMISFMDSNHHVGAVGPELLNPDGSIQYYSKRLPNLVNQAAVMFHFPGYKRSVIREFRNPHPHEVERVKGACLMIRRSIVNEIGLLNENSFLFSEEDDWSIKLNRKGWKIYYIPAVKVIHFGSASIKQISGEAAFHLYKSKTQFFREHHGYLNAAIFKAMLTAKYIVFWASCSLFSLAQQKYKIKRKEYGRLLRGISDF
jgi:GT2 family glycosyltransferase